MRSKFLNVITKITKLEYSQENLINSRKEIISVAQIFYGAFYNSNQNENNGHQKIKTQNVGLEFVPEIERQVLWLALGQMNNVKSGSEDRIISGILRMGSDNILEKVQIFLSNCLSGGKFQKNAKIAELNKYVI